MSVDALLHARLAPRHTGAGFGATPTFAIDFTMLNICENHYQFKSGAG
jgi:hypothetical protein